MPTQGTVSVAGSDLRAMAEGARDRWRGRTIGLVPQRLHLVGALNVRDNLRLAQSLPGLPAGRRADHRAAAGGRRGRPRASLSARTVAGAGAARRRRARGGQSPGAAAGRRADGEPRRRARGAGAGTPARAGARGGRHAGRRVARRPREAAAAVRVRAAGARGARRLAGMAVAPMSLVRLAHRLCVAAAAVHAARDRAARGRRGDDRADAHPGARARRPAHARRGRHRPRRRREGQSAAARARGRLSRRRAAGQHSAVRDRAAPRESADRRGRFRWRSAIRCADSGSSARSRRSRTSTAGRCAKDACGTKPQEAVLGSAVARATGLAVGDAFAGSHGLAEGGGEHADAPYRVTGILAPTGTVLDRLVLTAIASVWAVHDVHHADAARDAQEAAGDAHAGDAPGEDAHAPGRAARCGHHARTNVATASTRAADRAPRAGNGKAAAAAGTRSHARARPLPEPARCGIAPARDQPRHGVGRRVAGLRDRAPPDRVRRGRGRSCAASRCC